MAVDGLDVESRHSLRDELSTLVGSDEWSTRALALITHHREEIMGGGADQVLAPTHGLLLGQGEDGLGYEAGEWAAIAPHLTEYFDRQAAAQWVKPERARTQPRGAATTARAAEERAPLVDFRSVTVQYNAHVVFDDLRWMVRESEKWVVLGGNGARART